MIETLAIKTALSSAGGFLKQVPREVWYAIAGFAWWFFSAHYIGVGEDRVWTQLKEAEQAAQEAAADAVKVADEEAKERAEAQAEVLAEQIEAIEKAKANDENALDAIF